MEGKELKAALLRHGVTQARFANAIGVDGGEKGRNQKQIFPEVTS